MDQLGNVVLVSADIAGVYLKCWDAFYVSWSRRSAHHRDSPVCDTSPDVSWPLGQERILRYRGRQFWGGATQETVNDAPANGRGDP